MGKSVFASGTAPSTKAKNPEMNASEQAYVNTQVMTRPIEFQPITDEEGNYIDAAEGINVTFRGKQKFGKTLNGLLWGYFNSEYKSQLRAMNLDHAIEVMDQGVLPEIEYIIAIDTECDIKANLRRGKMKQLCGKLRKKIKHVPTPLQRKVEGMKDGKAVTLNALEIDAQRQNIEAAIWKAVDTFGENVMIFFDSASDYKKALDDLSDVVFKKTVKTSMSPAKGKQDTENDPFWRSFYQYRNKWWHNSLIKLKSFQGWCISTIKEEDVEEEYRVVLDKNTKKPVLDENGNQIFKPPTKTQEVARTAFRIDQGYSFRDRFNLETGEYEHCLRWDWGKWEHPGVKSFDRIGNDWKQEHKCYVPYHYNHRLAMMEILNDLGPSILGELEEGKTDDDLW